MSAPSPPVALGAGRSTGRVKPAPRWSVVEPDLCPLSKAKLDFAGFNFWLAKLNQFHGNFVNAEMVKAFITSAEFRQRFGPP